MDKTEFMNGCSSWVIQGGMTVKFEIKNGEIADMYITS